mmetsp:Transcript_57663/g.135175  ORF Transcript_57663/g.135175 Transcript_57663/m.135175 type:complete len:213 (-) Transcript_57663:33-671(-)
MRGIFLLLLAVVQNVPKVGDSDLAIAILIPKAEDGPADLLTGIDLQIQHGGHELSEPDLPAAIRIQARDHFMEVLRHLDLCPSSALHSCFYLVGVDVPLPGYVEPHERVDERLHHLRLELGDDDLEAGLLKLAEPAVLPHVLEVLLLQRRPQHGRRLNDPLVEEGLLGRDPLHLAHAEEAADEVLGEVVHVAPVRVVEAELPATDARQDLSI